MQPQDGNARRDPRELGDDEVEFLSDTPLAALAQSPRLADEQRAFIGQHVNHPSSAGWSLILDWARQELDAYRYGILLEASRRPRIAENAATLAAGTPKNRRWQAMQAAIDAAAKADARLSRKTRIAAAERLAREYQQQLPIWAGFGVAVILILLGFFLFGVLRQESRLEDCVLQGRHNCAAIIEEGR